MIGHYGEKLLCLKLRLKPKDVSCGMWPNKVFFSLCYAIFTELIVNYNNSLDFSAYGGVSSTEHPTMHSVLSSPIDRKHLRAKQTKKHIIFCPYLIRSEP